MSMGKPKVLVIDDDAAIRKWLITVLSEEGYACQGAEDGQLGSAMAESLTPDVILCDIQMPKATGQDVFEQLSKNPKTALIPFIFLTGNTLPKDVRSGMNLGADDYLTKPIVAADLLNSVRARLNKKKSLDQQIQIKVQHVRDALAHENFYDALTHLPNRKFLLKQFQGISRGDLQMIPLAIVNIAVDSIVHITEAFGVSGANSVLKKARDRIKRCLNSEDLLYRGGEYDSFDVLIWNAKEPEEIEIQIQEILQSFSEPITVNSHVCRIKASIGWTVYDVNSGEPLETFLNHAATARHNAVKKSEKSHQRYFPEMQKLVIDRLMLETYLYSALKNKEFILLYQPQVDIKTGKIKAVEALIRWNSKELGMVSPLQFIPFAEESGLILQIGKWVLEESCRQLNQWQQDGWKLKMAVNISGRQLEAGDLTDNVKEALRSFEISPDSLEIEITESLLIKDFEKTTKQMEVLKKQGITIAIDDFGTGYSSLSNLKKLPFDTLKIDRAFIVDIDTYAENAEIVAAIIKIAKTLKLKTLAEGVETREQLECLRNLDCDEYQGFLFSRPVSDSEISRLLKAG